MKKPDRNNQRPPALLIKKSYMGHLVQFENTSNSFFKKILFECWICECTTDTIFAESHGVDVHSDEQIVHGGRRPAIPLEFDNRYSWEGTVSVIWVIVKTEPGIHRQTLCHTMVDERNSIKPVFEMRLKLIRAIPGVFR